MKNNYNLNFEAISGWFATGFFFNNEGFLKEEIKNNKNKKPSIIWHYSPNDISFEETLNIFSRLFESSIKKKTKRKKILLPLSGGLDSRTIAAALIGNENVIAYSYEFENGIEEIKYARQIAEICGWDFYSFKIPYGYLWDNINKISEINMCRTEFTHPRQMAVIEEISSLGDILLSGSMGDLLFNSFNTNKLKNKNNQIEYLLNSIIKPSGKEIANDLWEYWVNKGLFSDLIENKIKNLYSNIQIDNPASKIRAFKSMYYVQNWTNNNMRFFSKFIDVYAPYHDNQICELVCSIPENFLNNRRIQIEYIKKKSPDLAKVNWQNYDLDLYTYNKFNSSYLPRRIYRYTKRNILEKILFKSPKNQRNWELQFLGKKNDSELKKWIFNNPQLNNVIPSKIIYKYYNKFKKLDPVRYSHCISMLLTFSVWIKKKMNHKS